VWLGQIDGVRHVIHVGSFTKLIGKALRVGFVAADPALIAQLVERKVLSVLSGSALLESCVAEVLDSGRYRKHLDTVRARLSRMRRDARQVLAGTGISFEGATGEGIFLWGRVPDSVPVDALVRAAREQSILLAKGVLFSPSKSCGQWLRFNVAHSTAPPLIQFLGDALKAAA
jgi:DNA-binding transcriptional MocR family regulator